MNKRAGVASKILLDFKGNFKFVSKIYLGINNDNQKNDSTWLTIAMPLKFFQEALEYLEGEEIEADSLNTQTDKFQQGVIFRDAISSQGLIPSNTPINVTE
ncbi:unnamed protein product [Rotaria sordida]|uniref:Uncharacterized protein n=1 Tax=Rotaria sordida TaxID=392033 RepID=A0A815IRK0_9BILA|nr:unnamed protein product [Rotaria sordida]CAF3559310.1 unnamed protein product [Rotaria sordida]